MSGNFTHLVWSVSKEVPDWVSLNWHHHRFVLVTTFFSSTFQTGRVKHTSFLLLCLFAFFFLVPVLVWWSNNWAIVASLAFILLTRWRDDEMRSQGPHTLVLLVLRGSLDCLDLIMPLMQYFTIYGHTEITVMDTYLYTFCIFVSFTSTWSYSFIVVSFIKTFYIIKAS